MSANLRAIGSAMALAALISSADQGQWSDIIYNGKS